MSGMGLDTMTIFNLEKVTSLDRKLATACVTRKNLKDASAKGKARPLGRKEER
jgi:hypothetical protein